MKSSRTSPNLIAAVAIVVFSCSTHVQAQYVPVFYDGFAVSADTFNVNSEIASRQAGVLASIPYVSIPGPPEDPGLFQHQLFSAATSAGQPLQLAEVGNNPPGASPIFSYKTMVSPDFNFNGEITEGIVGKRVSFSLDVGVIADEGFPGSGTFTKAGITIGGQSTLLDSEDEVATQEGLPPSSYFGIHFVEDGLGPEPFAFMQAYVDGFVIEDVGNSGVVVPHGGGEGVLSVQLDIDDPEDGNPWDGVGSTQIDVSVNGAQVYSYTKGDGGFTDNFITLFGSRQFAGNALATHLFDEFTVFAAPTVPSEVLGDYNADGFVDAADYTVFRDSLGLSIALPGENPAALTPGLVDAEDLTFWASQFGAPAIGVATGVPEPGALALVAIVLVAGFRRR